ncbi:ATP F0F1 synthase synthase [Motiliproteus sp. MSK22-1]|uniref:ATP F0F1 synthase synthase n=1 Tax=Motiliproteus sp. MSK22-1 TaxID=1897630 RepID=UPI0009774314|nr:ATP F0F1 synthase synthase [Motiliproteus sp. MSK22-1]OMH27839.1 ATP F0F1 synthase synthase [Motiliproteus sp. MSK22-1]
MDHVFAKVKGLRKNPFFKMISDCTLFEPVAINLAGCVDYNPDHNLDEDAWFKIDQFSQKGYCIDLLKNDFDSKDYADLTKAQFAKISYLFAVQGDDFYFQKITPSLFMKKKMIGFGECAEIEESGSRLVINSQPDAIYIKAFDTLVFRSLATISSIFKSIDSLYKEATNAEVEQFLDTSFIELTNEYDVTKVSKPNRKRVALAMATLDSMSDQDKTNMLTYIDGYCKQQLQFDKKNSKLEISSDNDLKLLLYGIEQRFYTTPFGQEKRLANSVQSLA